MTDHPSEPSHTCPDCGGDNRCTLNGACWCMTKPRTGTDPVRGVCKCERCLDQALAEQRAIHSPSTK